jgi:hypothetical protein
VTSIAEDLPFESRLGNFLGSINSSHPFAV